jgi:L-ascorbate metabolism protein UlaG (beta-lactamase superfamily)
MQVTWFGHSAFRLDFQGACVMIDPFFAGGTDQDALAAAEGCTHVLLTHGHDDHVGSTAAICKATGAQLVSSFEVCMWLSQQGAENINPGNIGGTVDCGGFTVSFVNALHSSGTVQNGQSIYLGNPMGLVVKAPGEPVLYHLGDTDIFGDMALINEIHRPEVGIVPIGDRFTMGAKTAALACQRFFDFATIIPCHYATFPMLAPSADAFVAALGADGGKVVVPAVGKPFTVTAAG